MDLEHPDTVRLNWLLDHIPARDYQVVGIKYNTARADIDMKIAGAPVPRPHVEVDAGEAYLRASRPPKVPPLEDLDPSVTYERATRAPK